MKLISFAVISLLAITVSAYPGLGTPPQGGEQSESTSTPSAHQPQGADAQSAGQLSSIIGQNPWQLPSTIDQDSQQPHADTSHVLQEYHEQSLQTKLNELDKKYQETQGVANKIQDTINVLKHEMWNLKAKLGELKAGPEYAEVFEEYRRKSKALDKERDYLTALKDDMGTIMDMYDRTVNEIISLNEAQQ
ncbi:hypothetical protein BASA50_003746 [Batrachochytrium salamandrivorans]|uniref:Uncharacterized protein n=1 Tax=Batrachochytrium salamandrivorans TaxID=1357716 RepID=A0ABQ8FIB3_9FUNG|nr:hypothetical protein BASA60_009522 [Batrachochytrium salamandrivorans]KAH6579951.1 hypothetical protein BASA61_009939 [Batrachochytrium salamandrivorans]KAH6598712.1 hypothetical protein BASA50_003746 [Batrachochytrium salamandrivorans]KAH9245192.1 hypothetical protein BASA81_017331 [Batrachochytrium salamandrivorans]KAH9267839.1 hypothetical protein BASA83_009661 [Batrachochytrium salamandrivorans]